MQFYRRSTNVSAEMEEMSSEGKKTAPLSAARDAAASDDVDGKVVTDAGADIRRPSYTLWRLFTDADLRMPLFIACALVVMQQFSGINAVRRFVCYRSSSPHLMR